MVFDEQEFPFAHLHPNAGTQLRKEVVLLPAHLLNARGVDGIDQIITNHINSPGGSDDLQDTQVEDLEENDVDLEHGVDSQPHLDAATAPTDDPYLRSEVDTSSDPEADRIGTRSRVDPVDTSTGPTAVVVGSSPGAPRQSPTTRGSSSPARRGDPTSPASTRGAMLEVAARQLPCLKDLLRLVLDPMWPMKKFYPQDELGCSMGLLSLRSILMAQ